MGLTNQERQLVWDISNWDGSSNFGQVVCFSESNYNLGGHSETETANIYIYITSNLL